MRGDWAVEEPIVLDTYEHRLSYAFGASNARNVLQSSGPNAQRLNKELILEGFKQGLEDKEGVDCRNVIQGLV